MDSDGVADGVDTALALSEIGDRGKYCYSPAVPILLGCSNLRSVSLVASVYCVAVHTLCSEITTWSRVLPLEANSCSVNKFLAFCAARKIPLLILVLWQVNPIHCLFVKKDPFNVSFGRCLGHPSGFFSSCFLTITTHLPSPPCVPHVLPISFSLVCWP